MIKYSLICKKGHEFESWFAGSEAFDKLAAAGQVECPNCGSAKVSKALMAPSVSTARKKEVSRKVLREQADKAQQIAKHMAPSIPAPASIPAPPATVPNVPPSEASAAPVQNSAPVALLDGEQKKLREAIKELHSRVTENTVDVGENFPSEARKIHDGDAPVRAIRGQASFEEAKDLWEEGIPVLPLPSLPEDKN